jgi:hypothetical protein
VRGAVVEGPCRILVAASPGRARAAQIGAIERFPADNIARPLGSHEFSPCVALFVRGRRNDSERPRRGKHKLAVSLLCALHGMNHVGGDL